MFGVIADLAAGLGAQMHAEEMQEDSQVYNAGQAALKRDWDERMDNTKYQRATKDLEAAGLNRILAYTHGATTPSGASASSGIASPANSSKVAAGMQSASAIELNDAVIKKTEAEAARTKAEEEEIRARTPRHEWDIAEIQSRIPRHQHEVLKIQQEIGESAVRIERIWAEERHLKSSAAHHDQQVANLQAAIPLIKAQIANLKALTEQSSAATQEIKQRIKAELPQLTRILGNLEAQARETRVPGQRNEQAAQESFIGQLGAYLRSINPLNNILNQVPR